MWCSSAKAMRLQGVLCYSVWPKKLTHSTDSIIWDFSFPLLRLWSPLVLCPLCLLWSMSAAACILSISPRLAGSFAIAVYIRSAVVSSKQCCPLSTCTRIRDREHKGSPDVIVMSEQKHCCVNRSISLDTYGKVCRFLFHVWNYIDNQVFSQMSVMCSDPGKTLKSS